MAVKYDRTLSFLHASLSAFLRVLADFLVPPLCLNCHAPVAQSHTLCATCWKAIHFIDAPCCALCGAPFDLPVEDGTLCGACLSQTPAFDGARAAFLYDDASKGLVLRFKHADHLHLMPALGAWIVRAGTPFWAKTDIIAPVPLHRWRFMRRRYNQAALLAKEASHKTGTPVVVDLLSRVRATESQGHKNKQERIANLKGAFALRSRYTLTGKTITLIDDVMTSGATAEACAKILKKEGASKVYVVTLARTRLAN